MTETTTRQPIPVQRLVRAVVDDGADYDDCLEGYTAGVLDEATGVLTLRFRRHEEAQGLDPDDDWASAEYRFALLGDHETHEVQHQLRTPDAVTSPCGLAWAREQIKDGLEAEILVRTVVTRTSDWTVTK